VDVGCSGIHNVVVEGIGEIVGSGIKFDPSNSCVGGGDVVLRSVQEGDLLSLKNELIHIIRLQKRVVC